MLNQISIMGRLVRDAELRYTKTGSAVANYTLAVERDFVNKDGKKDVDFIDCVVLGSAGEKLAKYLTKGRQILTVGRLQIVHWEDNNGTKHKQASVVVNRVYFCDSKRSLENADDKSEVMDAVDQENVFIPMDVSEIDADDLPF